MENIIASPQKQLINNQELRQVIFNYLSSTYYFRRLEIEQWLGLEQINYIRKDDSLMQALDNQCAEDLWHNGYLEDWNIFQKESLAFFYEDLLWQHMDAVGFKRKKMVIEIMHSMIEGGELTRTIRFDPKLKAIIAAGRQKVKGVKPLHYASGKRQLIALEEGQLCYFNWYSQSPYIANPAMVYKKRDNSYRLLFFTNMRDGSETARLNINLALFITVPADELGRTPSEAVLQRFC